MSPRPDYAEVAYLTTSWGPVELMRTSYHRQAFPRHWHDYYTIGLMLEGRGTMWYRGSDHATVAGDVIVIPPGEVHTGGVDRGADVLCYLALHVPPEVFGAATGTRTGAALGAQSPVSRDEFVATCLRRMGLATESRDAGAIDDLLGGIMRSLVRRVPSSASLAAPVTPPDFVRTAIAILESAYADPAQTSLLALSRQAGVTPFHLVREFTASTGLSPHRYLVQLRVRRACECLARGMPVSIAAASTGFADQSHLTTQFKRYVGVTPAAYRGYGSAQLSWLEGFSAEQ